MQIKRIIRRKMRGTPYGGVILVADAFKKLKLKELITEQLPSRVKQAKFGYDDVILTSILLAFCAGKYIENVNGLKYYLEQCRLTKIPSSDTIARVLKSLAVPNHIYEAKSYKSTYEINVNKPMINLNIRLLKRLNLIKKRGNTLDFDASVIPNYKYDRMRTYNQKYGYNPMFGIINNQHAVYCEARSGNCTPGSNHLEPVKYTVNKLKEQGSSVSIFRADAAAYRVDLINFLEEERITFFIRAQKSWSAIEEINYEGEWFSLEVDGEIFEVAETMHQPNGATKPFRLVITRKLAYGKKVAPTKDGLPPLKKDDPYVYRGILTSDYKMSMLEVVKFYNRRGGVERNLELMRQLNTSRLPFSFLNQNAVYLLVTMMSFNLFRYLTKTFGEKVDFVRSNMYFDNFFTEFIVVIAWWGNGRNRGNLHFESQKGYEVLLE